jgi:hypothetical protein
MLTIPDHKENGNQNHCLRFHLTPVRIVTIKDTKDKCLRGCAEKGTLMPLVGM